MKKISTKNWERYKESAQGKAAIAEFARLYNENVPVEDILQLCKKYDPQYFTNRSEREETVYCLGALNDFDSIIGDAKEVYKFEDDEDTEFFYVEEVLHGVIEPSLINEEGLAPQQVYKSLLSANMFISTMLYCYMPERYLPNLWVMQYKYFRAIAMKYEIELPKEPHRAEYLYRNTYYLAVNNAMFNFCNANGITEPAEICAFFYDYQLELIKEELEEECMPASRY